MEENSSLGRIEAASVTLKIGAYSFLGAELFLQI